MNELNKKMQEYSMRFGDGFPMIPLGMGRSNEEIIKIIDECLKKGKDAYDLGYLENDVDIDY